MPTYDYRCDACDHKFDKFQSITADPDKKCPSCGKNKARRLIGTGAGIIFKGGGFYETDYRSDSYAKDAKNDSGEKKPETGEKADKKPETKAVAESESSASPAKSVEAKPAKTEAKPAKSEGKA